MHAFSRIFTTDLVANDCRVFDWLGAEYAIQNKLAVCLVSTLDWDNMAGIPQDICHIDSAEFSTFGLKLSLSGYNVPDPYSLG